ncbi:alpha/beta-Hydrolase [Glarea lozoyensis ATCC 20868]|uniref:Alpha/beta-Hydrolase n=1 Tax=Glarea lozoyensis (strain ATCC 20868 / MF5171) TaxID=1116229 RepID=S3D2U0_GLAL2|nr:alpha/beta-Hydrolase [Glarea lozoyensis ATCC 20868]EPE31484.1 alpha/beta-Hydrolase [Glarea lozoyensis ATCC 20868]
MAPTASDPRDLRLVLNPARRKAFTLLIGSMVAQMRKSMEYSFEPLSTPIETPAYTTHANYSVPQSEASDQQKLESRLDTSLPTTQLNALKKDALRYFDKWSDGVRVELRKITDGQDDRGAAQRREEWLANRNPPPPPYSPFATTSRTPEQAASAATAASREAREVTKIQSLYTPIATRFTTISREDRVHVVSCMLLLLLASGHYSAHSRTLLCILTSSFALPISVLATEETEVSRTLLTASKAMTADAETLKRAQENQSSRRWKVGLASVAGAALIGVTGGIAAPVVAGAIGGLMGGIGLGGVASVLGIFAMNGALVGTLFGAFGGKMTGEMVDAYAREVEDFNFKPVASEWGEHTTDPAALGEARRLRVTIGINGWLNEKEDIVRPWRVLGQDSEVFALRYEMEALLSLGCSIKDMVSSYAWSYVKLEILKRTVLASLWSALWPVYLLKVATSLDTPFAVAKHRSEKAGEVLADALINRAQGERPVTLIGYSLGARVIYCCLKSLSARRAFGIVENVVLIGAPVPLNRQNWQEMRAVVSGKLVNVHSENDYILAFLYRATSIQYGVAGLQPITGLEGVTNEDLSNDVSGHLRYPDLVGKILKRIGIEHVDVEDEDIEVDPEIKIIDNEDLIDFGDNTKDSEPLTNPYHGSRIVDNHSTHQGLSRDMTTAAQWEESMGSSQILERHTSTSGLTAMMAGTSLEARTPPTSITTASSTHRREVTDQTHIAGTSLLVPMIPRITSPVSPAPPLHTIKSTAVTEDDHYSSSDDGGIVMEDNDDYSEDGHLPAASQSHPHSSTQRDNHHDQAGNSQHDRVDRLIYDNFERGGPTFDEPKSLGGFQQST